MGQCICGKTIDETEGLCARCRALGNLDLTSGTGSVRIEEAYHGLIEEWHPKRSSEDPRTRKAAENKIAAVKAAYTWLTAEENTEQSQAADDTAGELLNTGEQASDKPPSEHGAILQHPQIQRGITALLLCGTIAAGLVTVDSVLSLLPATAPAYVTFKINSRNAVMARLPGMIGSHGGHAGSEEASSGFPSSQPDTERSPAGNRARHGAAQASADDLAHELANAPLVKNAQAYVTLGLTPVEVAAVLGSPTSVSAQGLTYGRSEIYLRNGRVVGWKIDLASSPLRVRLWPHHAFDPQIDTFTTGSTMDQVIFVQGTPTLVADNKFGYGKSQVFFEGGRVIGWLIDPRSVSLRVHEE